jgi:hypothetical protein
MGSKGPKTKTILSQFDTKGWLDGGVGWKVGGGAGGGMDGVGGCRVGGGEVGR